MKRVHGNALLFGLAGTILFAVAAGGQSATAEVKQPDGSDPAGVRRCKSLPLGTHCSRTTLSAQRA
jgi:hypothetical protein